MVIFICEARGAKDLHTAKGARSLTHLNAPMISLWVRTGSLDWPRERNKGVTGLVGEEPRQRDFSFPPHLRIVLTTPLPTPSKWVWHQSRPGPPASCLFPQRQMVHIRTGISPSST